MIHVLWLAPTFNHYKARFLNYLANVKEIKLTVLSGTGREGMGDKEIDTSYHFNQIRLNINKQNFGKSALVRKSLKGCFKNYDWVLIPTEKKNLLLFIYALYLRIRHRETKLFTYTHPISKSGKRKTTFLDWFITKFYYKQLNRVIFYTEQSCQWAIEKKLIDSKKAYWANNTIDTLEVKKYYSFELPLLKTPAILFIGRLIPSKRLHDLIRYYKVLKTHLPNLKLDIIGDGPELSTLISAIKEDKNITHHGAVVDEVEISKIMKTCSIVFVPGLSGLSINHAFTYSRPYITLEADKHGPEINYLEHGKNGYILSGTFHENTTKLLELLTSKALLTTFCQNAKVKGEELSIEHWVQQITFSLLHE
ncbi:glycosyltransferase family 4 protein [Flavivirga aquimarina]|uniref:Glycosyltransferase family 4 protein n=1 Tax=Flavivirga aquimarina TaxID=2027862 RepID=A0ABT8W705_9FLAO|nr:glycosyltransferase family 4 protein [Flavivirga aquimarina]MDO5968905.1 glycosyltransferase family 4 protein [Flavivirga aquimarina]